MELNQLFIAEYASLIERDESAAFSSSCAFEIRTCQRTLQLSYGSKTTLNLPVQARRTFEGSDAYEFLLRFACGLESEIKGETDVFGQVKTAFQDLLIQNPTLAQSFQPVFQKLFEDTKEIRAQYLHGIGGNTYGSLSRRLLAPIAQDRVLILGAGQLSKSVAPYFAQFNLRIWNRSNERLIELSQELLRKGCSDVGLLRTDAELEEAIQNSTLIILATPAQSAYDELVLKHASASALNPKILHLGGTAEKLTHFNHYPHFGSLSDLFMIEKEQSDLRKKQVDQAMEACHHRALLRNLSRSIHIAHGWEDLAVFNS